MSHSILVIDDEIHLCASMKYILEYHEFHVETASSADEAHSLLLSKHFDAVLLDINLPDPENSGLVIAEYIRKHLPTTAVIIQTGKASVDTAIEAIRNNVYDYLRKPCDPDLLVKTITKGILHKGLEQQLYKSEKRFRQLSEATWEGLAIFRDNRLIQVNNQLCELLGYDEQELIDMPLHAIIPDWEICHSLFSERGSLASSIPTDINGQKKDGTLFPVELRLKHLDYADQQTRVMAIKDITAEKIAEQQQAEMQEKLADARRMESLGLMAGSVAHDLNNILTNIVTFPDLLLTQMSATEKYRVDIELIQTAGKQAAAVIADLLTVVRGTKCKKEPHDLNLLVKTYIDSINCQQLKNAFPDIKIDYLLEPNLPNIQCSVIHISKSIINLVNNGVEAIEHAGRIKIRTSSCSLTETYAGYEDIPPGDYVRLSVADSGSGISPQGREHIFEPFYSKKELGRSGTGLGLTIIWNTVRDHQGFIDLTSNESGTCFELYFPVTKQQSPPLNSTSQLESLTGAGQTILVVDDEQSQRSVARSILEQLGYTAYTVESGEAAIAFVQQQPVDLILLDIVMAPGMDGCQTFREILNIVPSQKAIMTSGYCTQETLLQLQELGIVQYVTKPYSLTHIGKAIKEELHREVTTN